MAIGTVTQPVFWVDTEAERSTSWPESSIVYCKDTKCIYVLKSGAFYTIPINYNDLANKPTIPSAQIQSD